MTAISHDLWTEEMERDLIVLRRLYSDYGDWGKVVDHLQKLHPDRKLNYKSVHKKYQRLQLDGDVEAVALAAQNIMPRDGSIITFLSKGRTIEDIVNKFKIDIDEATDLVKSEYDNHEIWDTVNDLGHTCYIAITKLKEPPELKPRIWKYQMSPHNQPWIWIHFPDDFDAKVIKIFPLADLHRGGRTHSRESLLNYISYIASHDNAFACGIGDWFEMAIKISIGAGVYEADAPQTEAERLLDDIAPIAHKVLYAQPGNHEERIHNSVGLCPLYYLCDKLNIPYVNDQMHTTIFWKGHHWHIFSFHGSTSSRTEGGQINEAKRPLDFQGHIHFIVMGHVHKPKSVPVSNMVRNMAEFKIDFKEQHVVIAPSFLDYFGSYASRKAMHPGVKGATALAIYPDGDYKIDPYGD